MVLLFTTKLTFAESKSVVKVAAAANLRYAMEEIKRIYEGKNADVDLQINYGASGMFFQQITNGAPYDLFLSADDLFPIKLKEAGRTIGESLIYACGKLALYGVGDGVDKMGLELLTDPSTKRIAIANPRTAPYGSRSIDLLKAQGLWEAIERKVIYGDSISQTAQFATTGNADLGFVALSLLLNPEVELKGSYYEIPQNLYEPIVQAGILIKQRNSNEEAEKFFKYILSPECSEIWDKYGYTTGM